MNVIPYKTLGGKDLIKEYIDILPLKEKAQAYQIISALIRDGYEALDLLNTRHIDGKLWEIKFPQHNRIFYIVINEDNIFIPHACKKQKNKAEKFEIATAKDRIKEFEIDFKKNLM